MNHGSDHCSNINVLCHLFYIVDWNRMVQVVRLGLDAAVLEMFEFVIAHTVVRLRSNL